MKEIISQFISEVNARNKNEPEFMQAVTEVAENVIPYIVQNDIYYGQNILLRIAEPERIISFRVAWIDDKEEIQVNRGYRIEMNSLRFIFEVLTNRAGLPLDFLKFIKAYDRDSLRILFKLL